MQYEDRSASGFSRRKAQKANAAYYTPLNPPKSVDAAVLTALRQGRQTIVRTPATTVCGTTVDRDDPGCCSGIHNFTVSAVRTGCGSPSDLYTIKYTITWTHVPNTTASTNFQGISSVSVPFQETAPGHGEVTVWVQCGSLPTKCTFTLTSVGGATESVAFTDVPV